MSNGKWKRPNALRHGVFSATAILPGEDRQEFEELHNSLIREWQPDGDTESDAVLDIAKSIWCKRRVQKFFQIQVSKNCLDPNHPTYNEDLALKHFSDAVAQDPERAFRECTSSLHPERITYLGQKCPRTSFKTTKEWGAAVVNEIKSVLLEVDTPGMWEVAGLFCIASLFSDDLIRQELTLNERLSAIIERAVKRLVQMKAMKQMLAPTQIDQTVVAPKKSIGQPKERPHNH